MDKKEESHIILRWSGKYPNLETEYSVNCRPYEAAVAIAYLFVEVPDIAKAFANSDFKLREEK